MSPFDDYFEYEQHRVWSSQKKNIGGKRPVYLSSPLNHALLSALPMPYLHIKLFWEKYENVYGWNFRDPIQMRKEVLMSKIE